MITIKELAKIAGVSTSTISRSLNDKSEVPLETRERIKKLALDYGYECNVSARSLRLKKNNTVGVIFGDLSNYKKQYYNKISMEIANNLSRYSMNMLVEFKNNPHTKIDNMKKLISSSKVDGFIIIDSFLSLHDLELIKASKIPVIALHKPRDYENSNLSSIKLNQYEGSRLATQHLVDIGCKNIITITEKKGQSGTFDFELRTRGFIDTLKFNKLKVSTKNIIRVDGTIENVKEKLSKFIKTGFKIDGLFVQTDFLALGTISALKELGLTIPEDVSIIGFDNQSYGEITEPKLTTVNPMIDAIAKKSVDFLMEMIESKGDSAVVNFEIKPKLIFRETSKNILVSQKEQKNGKQN